MVVAIALVYPRGFLINLGTQVRRRLPVKNQPVVLLRWATVSHSCCWWCLQLEKRLNLVFIGFSCQLVVSCRKFLCQLEELCIFSGWWFQSCLFSPRCLGKWCNLTDISQMGWNQQLEKMPGRSRRCRTQKNWWTTPCHKDVGEYQTQDVSSKCVKGFS